MLSALWLWETATESRAASKSIREHEISSKQQERENWEVGLFEQFAKLNAEYRHERNIFSFIQIEKNIRIEKKYCVCLRKSSSDVKNVGQICVYCLLIQIMLTSTSYIAFNCVLNVLSRIE